VCWFVEFRCAGSSSFGVLHYDWRDYKPGFLLDSAKLYSDEERFRVVWLGYPVGEKPEYGITFKEWRHQSEQAAFRRRRSEEAEQGRFPFDDGNDITNALPDDDRKIVPADDEGPP